MDISFTKYVRKHSNLIRAWQAVRANSRFSTSPYIKDEVQNFGEDAQRRIKSISARIQHGTYKFSAGRGVAIKKINKPGSVRPIVISKIEDRIVQRCILDALTNDDQIRNRAFQPYSFGGIPKKDRDGLAGVPAAIKHLLDFIEAGATHVMVADIEGFFQHISKSACVKILKKYVKDQPFLELTQNAISVDLENARSLWRYKDQFPYGDIGVAQGNCLSPFLGNLILSEFDEIMNKGDCRCIRYIDDVIIVAPSGKAASARFRAADKILDSLGMGFAKDKTSKIPLRVDLAFEYLGIEFSRKLLRPSQKARKSILKRVEEVAAKSLIEMRRCKDAANFGPENNIPKTLNRISSMSKGWAHHYAFCNDYQTIKAVDEKIHDIYLGYMRKSQDIAAKKKREITAVLLGYRGLADVRFSPFSWPTPPPPSPASPPSASPAP